MIRRLRAKLVAIIMAFVAVILVCVMTAVLGLTRATLERESLDMMRHIALDPIQAPAPGEEFDGVRLPYFVLSVAEDGTIEPAGGGYYDLSDTKFLQQAAEEAVDSGAQSGIKNSLMCGKTPLTAESFYSINYSRQFKFRYSSATGQES